MDVVYICRPGENEELRYSIRSVEKNLEFNNLWVVGKAPDWYRGNLINVEPQNSKYGTARKNLRSLVRDNRINNDFILMNDDFFIMNQMNDVSIWHGGSLKDKTISRKYSVPNSTYTELLSETYMMLKRAGMPECLDYELHTPLPMTREGLARVVPHGGLWRSLYGNFNNIGGTEHKDVKVYGDGIKIGNKELDIYTSPYLSTDDASFNKIRDLVLSKRFNKPSSFE